MVVCSGRSVDYPRRNRELVSRNASFHEAGIAGVFFSPLKIAFALVLLCAAIIISAWVIDWIFVFRVWPEIGRASCRERV